MSERWRCFVAVPLTAAIRSALSASVVAWRREPPADALRWTDLDACHLTLAFLGFIAPDDVDSLSRAIGGVSAAHRPMRVETGRLGAFPRPRSAEVLWYGVSDPDGVLSALAADLACALGLAAGRCRPHITLARARRRPVDLRGWIEEASAGTPSGQLDVDAIRLMRSFLGRGPARYETLASFALGAAP